MNSNAILRMVHSRQPPEEISDRGFADFELPHLRSGLLSHEDAELFSFIHQWSDAERQAYIAEGETPC